jgi:hypothetical protein
LVSVYAPEKLIAQARKLAADYRRAMGKPLPGISNEIAEHDAIRLLGLQPRASHGEGGYQATDPARGDKRIQIKSRAIFDESKGGQRIGQLSLERDWDSVLLVLMDEDYQPYAMYEADRDDIEAFVGKSSQGRSKRGAMSVARFKIIGRLAWTREEGVEPEMWENQAP